MPFIGVVPAIKPAAAMSQKKKIAVLATARTIASRSYMALKREFADGVTVLDQACPGWVELVEQGHIDDAEADRAVRDVIEPLARQGVDAYVLGCTHYPFLRSLIQHYAGNGAAVLDSGEAVARQLQRTVAIVPKSSSTEHLFLTTGDPEPTQQLLRRLLRQPIVVTRA
jgi:glutamate racemase